MILGLNLKIFSKYISKMKKCKSQGNGQVSRENLTIRKLYQKNVETLMLNMILMNAPHGSLRSLTVFEHGCDDAFAAQYDFFSSRYSSYPQ